MQSISGKRTEVVGAVLFVLALCRTVTAAGTFKVTDFGSGASAFKAAFGQACNAGGGTVVVPPGEYTVQPFAISLCKDITFQVDGNINAPAKAGDWDNYKSLGKGKGWIQFDQMENLVVTGKGTFDGKASFTNWWGDGKAPISLSFTHCANLILRGFTVRNSPGTHVQVDLQMEEGVSALLAEYITIDSPHDSPNTDGIHLARTWNVIVRNCKIGCGDDNVVLQTDCKNVLIEDIDSGPGNGISLGSLGNGDDSCMNNILVQRCKFTDTNNGARIKAWKNSGGGAATGVVFRDLTMVNVKWPILISQCYSGGTANMCTGDGQSVAVYDILFERISGTCFDDMRCITISCCDKTPCVGITLRDISLSGAIGPCTAAYGSEINVSPSGCLTAGKASGTATAAAESEKCGYGSNGHYTTSGPGAPGCPLAKLSTGYTRSPPATTYRSPPPEAADPPPESPPPPTKSPPPPTESPPPPTESPPPPTESPPPPKESPPPPTESPPPPKESSPPPPEESSPPPPEESSPPPPTESPPPPIPKSIPLPTLDSPPPPEESPSPPPPEESPPPPTESPPPPIAKSPPPSTEKSPSPPPPDTIGDGIVDASPPPRSGGFPPFIPEVEAPQPDLGPGPIPFGFEPAASPVSEGPESAEAPDFELGPISFEFPPESGTSPFEGFEPVPSPENGADDPPETENGTAEPPVVVADADVWKYWTDKLNELNARTNHH